MASIYFTITVHLSSWFEKLRSASVIRLNLDSEHLQYGYSSSSRSKMFFKIGVLRNIHMKTTVLEFLFNKVTGLKTWNCIKKETPTLVFSNEYCEILRRDFIQHPWWLFLLQFECNSPLHPPWMGKNNITSYRRTR